MIFNNPFLQVSKTYSFLSPDVGDEIKLIFGIALIIVAGMFLFTAITMIISSKKEKH